MARIIGLGVGSAFLLLLGAPALLGAFTRVVVSEREVGPHRFVYRTPSGASFRDVGVITDEVRRVLEAAGVTQLAPLDLFQPAGSERPNEIGFAVGERDAGKLARLDPSFFQRTLPAATSLAVRFPFRHPLSYLVGYFKVTPALRAYRTAHGYRDTASYTLHAGDTILYVQPVVK